MYANLSVVECTVERDIVNLQVTWSIANSALPFLP
jgi:hypothetical protein